jgi:hypothetical protein
MFGPINQPNTALFCTILALGTFVIAYYLKLFRNSQFLGRNVSISINNNKRDYYVYVVFFFNVERDDMASAAKV